MDTILPLGTIMTLYRDHADKPYWHDIVQSVAGHVLAIAMTRHNAVEEWRKLIGATDPRHAADGTLRALARDEPILANNVVHGSDSQENVEREARLLFGHTVWHQIQHGFYHRSMDGN